MRYLIPLKLLATVAAACLSALLLEDTSYRRKREFSQAEVMKELKVNNAAYYQRQEQNGRQAAAELRAQLNAAEDREKRKSKRSFLDTLLHGKYQPKFTEEELLAAGG
jgi:hypothetical protein